MVEKVPREFIITQKNKIQSVPFLANVHAKYLRYDSALKNE